MKIIRTGTIEDTIEEFADRHGLTMEISISRYSGEHVAHFQGTCVHRHADGKVNVRGFGKTDKEAIVDYARQISRKTLTLNALSEDRREVQVRRLA